MKNFQRKFKALLLISTLATTLFIVVNGHETPVANVPLYITSGIPKLFAVGMIILFIVYVVIEEMRSTLRSIRTLLESLFFVAICAIILLIFILFYNNTW